MRIKHFLIGLLWLELVIEAVLCREKKYYEYVSIVPMRFNDHELAQSGSFISPSMVLTALYPLEPMVNLIESVTFFFYVLNPAAIPLQGTQIPIEDLIVAALYPSLLFILLNPQFDVLAYVVPFPISSISLSDCSNNQFALSIVTDENGLYSIHLDLAVVTQYRDIFVPMNGIIRPEDLGGSFICIDTDEKSFRVGIVVEEDPYKMTNYFRIEEIGSYQPIFQSVESRVTEWIDDYALFTISTAWRKRESDDWRFVVPTAFNIKVQSSTFITDRLALTLYNVEELENVQHVTFFFNLVHRSGKILIIKLLDLALFTFSNHILLIALPKRTPGIVLARIPTLTGRMPSNARYYIFTINTDSEIQNVVVKGKYVANYYGTGMLHVETSLKITNSKVYGWNKGSAVVFSDEDGYVHIVALVTIGENGFLYPKYTRHEHAHFKYFAKIAEPKITTEYQKCGQAAATLNAITNIKPDKRGRLTISSFELHGAMNCFELLAKHVLTSSPSSLKIKELYEMLKEIGSTRTEDGRTLVFLSDEKMQKLRTKIDEVREYFF